MGPLSEEPSPLRGIVIDFGCVEVIGRCRSSSLRVVLERKEEMLGRRYINVDTEVTS